MLKNVLKYESYYAQIAYDPSADAFHGRVIGMQDVIDCGGGRGDGRKRQRLDHPLAGT